MRSKWPEVAISQGLQLAKQRLHRWLKAASKRRLLRAHHERRLISLQPH
jgi:hypothetical protein